MSQTSDNVPETAVFEWNLMIYLPQDIIHEWVYYIHT